MSDLKSILLAAPQGSHSPVDNKLKEMIKRWDAPPTAIQILEVLDHAINGALASSTVVMVLQIVYRATLESEGKTHEEVITHAKWRNE